MKYIRSSDADCQIASVFGECVSKSTHFGQNVGAPGDPILTIVCPAGLSAVHTIYYISYDVDVVLRLYAENATLFIAYKNLEEGKD